MIAHDETLPARDGHSVGAIMSRNLMTVEHDHSIALATQMMLWSATRHLPVMRDNEPLGYTYEQTTYPEWAFSAYRSGKLLGVDLLGKPDEGSKSEECQGCHLPSKTPSGQDFVSKIAGIQERTNFPVTDYAESAASIDLPYRTGFAKHSLVGLNLFVGSSVSGLSVFEVFRAAGAEWGATGCSLCVGMNGDAVPKGEHCASSSNRNFRGRQGPGARTHLMSPAMVAAAGVGLYPSIVAAAEAMAGDTTPVAPDEAAGARYRRLIDIYAGLYQASAETSHRLVAFAAGDET